MGVFQPFAAYPNFVEVSVSVEAVDVFVTIRAILVYTIVETTNHSVFTYFTVQAKVSISYVSIFS